MKSFVEIREEAESFLSYVFKVLEQAKCDVSGFDLDHICYRVVTVDEYLRLKKLLLKEGVLLADNHWNGREISVFELKNPIVFKGREISVFELPSPKKNVAYETGYEHIEFVVSVELRELIQNNPHLNFNTKGIDKDENPDIRLKFQHGVVKFHKSTLKEVVCKFCH